jgi:hypothetical protein
MRTSLLPKVPTKALAPKMKSATQSVVLNPMRFVDSLTVFFSLLSQ